MIPELRTARLLLRGWRDEDREPFAAIGADPEAMRYYPSLLTFEQSSARLQAYRQEWADYGFGKWAVEIPEVAPFAGSIGLSELHFQASFTPCIEIGWRLARSCWGQGYATEGARAALQFAFEGLGLEQIVAFTTPVNSRSVRVMEKLGMRYAGEFAHALLPPGHRLRRHVLYRLSGSEWRAENSRRAAKETARAADGKCIAAHSLQLDTACGQARDSEVSIDMRPKKSEKPA